MLLRMSRGPRRLVWFTTAFPTNRTQRRRCGARAPSSRLPGSLMDCLTYQSR